MKCVCVCVYVRMCVCEYVCACVCVCVSLQQCIVTCIRPVCRLYRMNGWMNENRLQITQIKGHRQCTNLTPQIYTGYTSTGSPKTSTMSRTRRKSGRRKSGRKSGRIDVCVYLCMCMGVRVYGCMCVCVYACMRVWVYGCMYGFASTSTPLLKADNHIASNAYLENNKYQTPIPVHPNTPTTNTKH